MKIISNLDLSGYNSYNIKSIAEIAYFPETKEELIEVANNPEAIVIGGGCNVIFSQNRYRVPFVFIKENYSGIVKKGESLIVKAGTDLKKLSVYAFRHSLTGLEYYYDIPGCVGGATIMNAGCQGVSFSDYIQKITYYNRKTKDIITISKEEAEFEYRGNIFNNLSVVILEVELKLKEGIPCNIKRLMKSNKETRWIKQPRDYPSAGSVFKRPLGHYVGPMVSDCGLKGYTVGGAMVSIKHAGFIINKGFATGKDIIELIRIIKNAVYLKFGVLLQEEQKII